MSEEHSQNSSAMRWQGRPVLGRILQITLIVFPFVLALFVSYGISKGISNPSERSGQVARMVFLTLISFVVMMATDRVTRLATPVAVLLRMTMVFPDKAPSRIRVAMRSSSDEELRRTMAQVKEEGLGKSANEAAETLMVLVAALNRHDRLTKGHSERTRAYADVIAGEMGLTTEERSKLRWAALLHDVGKMQIPGEILNKPGRLTDTEYEIVKLHPVIGADLVEPLREFLGPWADAVAQHHERWDGGGYPYGLAGNEICLGARIVAVADTFDVITSLRSYKKPVPAPEARQEVARCAGTQFDPEVVKAFLAISLGRFRWGLAPLSVLTQIPQLVAVASPVAGSVTSVATAAPAVMVGAMTMGAVAVAAESQPVEILAASDEIALLAQGLPDSTIPDSILPDSNIAVSNPTGPTTTSFLVAVDTQTESENPPTLDGTTTTLSGPAVTTSTSSSVSTSTPVTTAASIPRTTTIASTVVTVTTATTQPPTTQPPTTQPPTTATPGNPPNGVVPAVIGECLGDPDVTARQLRRKDRVDFHGCDLGADGPLDLSGFDLSGAHFHGGDWAETIFDGADLSNADFHELSMNNATFVGADLDDFFARDFSMVGANFSGADLTDAQFERGDLRGSSFASALIDSVDFSDINSQGVTFAGATITDSNMKHMKLRNASFAGTTLRKVNLEGADIRYASFDNADLDEVKFQRAEVKASTFLGADLEDVNFDHATGEAQLGSSGQWVDVKCPDGDDETPYRTCEWQP